MPVVRLSTFAAVAAALAATCGPAAAFDVIIQPHQNTAAESGVAADQVEPIEPSDWSALGWHPGTDPTYRSKQPRWTAPGSPSASATSWSRTDNADGSAAVTVKRSLPLTWESNVGADFSLAEPLPALPGPVDPAALMPGAASATSAGAAWASLSTPALDMPVGWDKASLDTRFEPANDLGKVGVSASKSLGSALSLTLHGGYSVAAPGIAVPEQAAKLTILPTGTALAAGRTMSTADGRWLHTISAEQTLFEGASLVGSISESPDGPVNSSILAKYQRHW